MMQCVAVRRAAARRRYQDASGSGVQFGVCGSVLYCLYVLQLTHTRMSFSVALGAHQDSGVLQVGMSCRALQCVAVCCSMLQRIVMCWNAHTHQDASGSGLQVGVDP